LIEVRPIGFDSLGVRSMATIIYTNDVNVLIDPAVSLAPRRYSLPPHDSEWEALHRVAAEIEVLSSDADVIVITHYHYDHHDPGKFISTEIYRGKRVLLKDPRSFINVSQKIRASRFLKLIRDLAKEIIIADSRSFRERNTTINFSKPVPHGINDRLGYVIMVSICEESECVIHTSDVEGPVTPYVIDFIREYSPYLVIMDGPATYLSRNKYPLPSIVKSVEYNVRLLNEVNSIKALILDHHLLRDLNYISVFSEIRSGLRRGDVRLLTAAEYLGLTPNLLEARRKELYGLAESE